MWRTMSNALQLFPSEPTTPQSQGRHSMKGTKRQLKNLWNNQTKCHIFLWVQYQRLLAPHLCLAIALPSRVLLVRLPRHREEHLHKRLHHRNHILPRVPHPQCVDVLALYISPWPTVSIVAVSPVKEKDMITAPFVDCWWKKSAAKKGTGTFFRSWLQLCEWNQLTQLQFHGMGTQGTFVAFWSGFCSSDSSAGRPSRLLHQQSNVVDRRGKGKGRREGGPVSRKDKARKAETRHCVLINRISKIESMTSYLFSSYPSTSRHSLLETRSKRGLHSSYSPKTSPILNAGKIERIKTAKLRYKVWMYHQTRPESILVPPLSCETHSRLDKHFQVFF